MRVFYEFGGGTMNVYLPGKQALGTSFTPSLVLLLPTPRS